MDFLTIILAVMGIIFYVFLFCLLWRLWKVLGQISDLCSFLLKYNVTFQQVMNALRRFCDLHSGAYITEDEGDPEE